MTTHEIETEDHGRIEVESLESESHHGTYHRIQATDSSLTLTDESGNDPWVPEEDLSQTE